MMGAGAPGAEGCRLAWGTRISRRWCRCFARLMTDVAPSSVVVLRLPSALACAALVLLTGLIARELG